MISPSSSQDVRYYSRGGNRIRALDINSGKTHVVLAGNKILRTLRIENDNTCVEEYDIRDAASNTSDITAAQRDTFEIEDVAWSRDNYKDYIATAARNGKILLYNITRPEVEISRLHDHLQQVHKVDFSPLEGGCLLSASQDGTVRLWDLRETHGSSMVCSSHDTFHAEVVVYDTQNGLPQVPGISHFVPTVAEYKCGTSDTTTLLCSGLLLIIKLATQ